MNAKAKRRRAVPEAPRQESPVQAGGEEAARAEAALPAEGGLILSEHLPASRFVRLEVPGEPYAPCNPSIAKDGRGGLSCLVRTVNYELGEEDGIWFRGDPAPNTRNYIISINPDLSQGVTELVDDREQRQMRLPAQHGLEDGRLFWWRDSWWFSASALHHGARTRTTMALCKLDGRRVSYLEFMHSPHSREMEKNWMPLVVRDRLSVVYSHHPAESYELSPNKRRIWLGECPALHGWSGGSQLIPYQGAHLGVIHQRRKHRNRVYYAHRVVQYNDNLVAEKIGKEFYFRGEQIEFCAGVVEHDGLYVLSFGVKDREAWLVSLTPSEIASLLA